MLDAAESVFTKKGFGAASMEEIAEEAGFSRAGLYSRFGSKEDLLAAVLDRHHARQADAFAAMAPPTSPLERAVDAAALLRQTTTLDLVPLELELRLNALRNPTIRQRVVDTDRRATQQMARLIEQNMQAAKHPLAIPAEDLADIGRAAVLGFMVYAALDDERADRYEQLIETVFQLLAEPAPTKSKLAPRTRRTPNRT
jgi:AcrR family transcriptional regulator